MLMQTYIAKQFLPISLQEAWDFFKSPHNLSLITPPHMQFKIVSGANKPMYAGQIIKYKLSPFKGWTTTWVTEITSVENLKQFVDCQLVGPYHTWHHVHMFKEVPGGVEMEDIVSYKVPLGGLGQFLLGKFIDKQVEGVFAYRKEVLEAKKWLTNKN